MIYCISAPDGLGRLAGVASGGPTSPQGRRVAMSAAVGLSLRAPLAAVAASGRRLGATGGHGHCRRLSVQTSAVSGGGGGRQWWFGNGGGGGGGGSGQGPSAGPWHAFGEYLGAVGSSAAVPAGLAAGVVGVAGLQVGTAQEKAPGQRWMSSWKLGSIGDTTEGSAEVASSSAKDIAGNGAKPYGETLTLTSGAKMIPHPEKKAKGGEDAYFISDCGRAIGVADGVGGWAEVGIDPGLYSRMLMDCSLEAAEQENLMTDQSPLRILKSAYNRTKVEGSSTACIATLGNGVLHSANLGDSGLIIVRRGEIVFKSPQQQHDFNFPFQLGSADGMSDPPEAAAMMSVPVMEDDIIVMGTDGLFDNVFTDEISKLAVLSHQTGHDPRQSANNIASLALLRAGDSEILSPFGLAAQQVGFMYKGGKMDDITVVVSFVEKVGKVADSKL